MQPNQAPVANAGIDQTVEIGGTVQLDGSGSSDADNDELTYQWTAPAGITLSSRTLARPEFTANAEGTYHFSLITNDGNADSAPDMVVIRVTQAQPPFFGIELEPNGTRTTATVVPVSERVSGALFIESDVDYYRWDLPSQGEVVVSLSVSGWSYSSMPIGATIYNESGVRIGGLSSLKNEPMTTRMIAGPGEIYVAVNWPENYVFDGSLTYVLEVSTSLSSTQGGIELESNDTCTYDNYYESG